MKAYCYAIFNMIEDLKLGLTCYLNDIALKGECTINRIKYKILLIGLYCIKWNLTLYRPGMHLRLDNRMLIESDL